MKWTEIFDAVLFGPHEGERKGEKMTWNANAKVAVTIHVAKLPEQERMNLARELLAREPGDVAISGDVVTVTVTPPKRPEEQ